MKSSPSRRAVLALLTVSGAVVLAAALGASPALAIPKEREAAAKAAARSIDWGLFVWRGDGRYWRAGAVKVFKTQGGAERAATRLYDADRSSQIVARPIMD